MAALATLVGKYEDMQSRPCDRWALAGHPDRHAGRGEARQDWAYSDDEA